MRKIKKEKVNHGIAISLMIILFFIMIMSFLFNIIGIEGEKTEIVGGVLETSLITAKNIFTREGIRYFFSSAINNFQIFDPLVKLIIVMIGISIGEASGLFKKIFSKFKKIRLMFLTAIVLFVSIVMNFLGNDVYILLIPLVAIMYKNINRNPVLGVITVFVGTTLGASCGMLFSYENYLLGNLTNLAAIVDIDKEYVFNMNSNLFISITSIVLLTIFGTKIIQNKLFPKYGKILVREDEKEFLESKMANNITTIVFVVLSVLLLVLIVPGFGILLDNERPAYMLKLLSDTSPFKNSFIYIFSIIIMITSYVYGKFSKNIKNSNEYSLALAHEFNDIGYIFVLMFILAQIIGILNWTNISDIIATRLINTLSTMSIAGVWLILITIIFIIIISFFIPDMYTKWALMAPLIVPLFMRANIVPDYTQFVFCAASSIGSALTPLLPCFVIMVGFAYKYSSKDDDISFSRMYKTVLPITLLLSLVLIVVVVGFYIVGFPVGSNTLPTL